MKNIYEATSVCRHFHGKKPVPNWLREPQLHDHGDFYLGGPQNSYWLISTCLQSFYVYLKKTQIICFSEPVGYELAADIPIFIHRVENNYAFCKK